MRWLVEVTALGKSDKESLVIDADSWQKALQAARAQRGDTAPMSGFSIELLDEGCRAVDPTSRVRYEVHKAPDEAATGSVRSQPPRPVSQSAAPAASHASPASAASHAAPAAPASVSTAPAAPVHPSAPPSVAPRKPIAPSPSSPRAAAAAPSGAVAPVAVARPAPAVQGPPPGMHAPPVASVHVAPVAAAPPSQHSDVAATVPSQIIFKREQDPSEAVPLAYREYVFLVAPETPDSLAETLLATQFELIRASLDRLPAGKLVNLAVFDVMFQGKPPVPPLATLSWKDWRGAPVLAFPRRAQPAPALAPQPVAVPFAAPAPPAPFAPVPAPAPFVPAPAAPVAFVAPPQAQAFLAPAPPAAFAPAPAQAFAPPVLAPTFEPAFIPATAPAQPARARAPSSGALRAGQPGARVRGEDLIADLFEQMHDLHFLRDAVEGGEFCLTLAMEKIPSQAGIVHLYDIDRREFLVSSTRGGGTSKLLLRRHSEGDPLLLAAMNKRRAIVLVDAGATEASMLERYGAIGGARSLIVAPVMQHGRFLGAIEILNPLDGQPYTEAEGNAVNYIAEQFAEFLAAHGVVTDPERISQRAPPEP